MSFEWLNKFQSEIEKSPDYAEKVLAAYKLGMRGKGSISGVYIIADPDGCEPSKKLDPDKVYHPDDAPRLPLPDCIRGIHCRCVYRPMMTYQQADT